MPNSADRKENKKHSRVWSKHERTRHKKDGGRRSGAIIQIWPGAPSYFLPFARHYKGKTTAKMQLQSHRWGQNMQLKCLQMHATLAVAHWTTQQPSSPSGSSSEGGNVSTCWIKTSKLWGSSSASSFDQTETQGASRASETSSNCT